MTRLFALLAPLFLLAACQNGMAGSQEEDVRPFAGIDAAETVRFSGTEPFWGGAVTASQLRYTTPDDPGGAAIAVDRFAGRNGVSWIGTLDGADFVLAVTPEQCRDGMSDRTYPYAALLKIGADQREGCAWTDAQPFTGPDAP